MARIALGREDKLRARLFYARTLPLLVASLAVGYAGLWAIRSWMAGSTYAHLATYLWMAVFFGLFIFANQALVVQPYRRATSTKTTRGKRHG